MSSLIEEEIGKLYTVCVGKWKSKCGSVESWICKSLKVFFIISFMIVENFVGGGLV